MDLHDLQLRYFGNQDMAQMPQSVLEAGLERMRVDFGLESDAGRRFALWALMFMLGDAPDLDVAFKNAAERDAARNFMDLAAGLSEE
ncbi:hypothetical protein GRI44_08460 [Altererythrobacter confluentis]|uniref:Uncharacterized protein n=1 Tax=Allopontixanthobacter confluentis TaxID=1849021 RepID=A0A6L7GFU7_9SPHN|nr:hypothetical protein [Allopontixanthobacter confluentis]MXP14779.1 hypothetical protein [Allopontixanthobacter confluentis]